MNGIPRWSCNKLINGTIHGIIPHSYVYYKYRGIHGQEYNGCDFKNVTLGGKLPLMHAPTGNAIGKAAKKCSRK